MTGQGGEGATIVLDENCTVSILFPQNIDQQREKKADYIYLSAGYVVGMLKTKDHDLPFPLDQSALLFVWSNNHIMVY